MLKPTVKTYIEKIIRYIQLAFSLAVVSLYTQDLNKGQSEFAPSRARWVYAVVTGYISLATGALYLTLNWWYKLRSKPLIECKAGWSLPLFLWEITIVILWLVVFGIFGKLYIGVEVSGGGSHESHLTAMHRAVWVDLVNLILWTITGTWRGLRWRRSKAASVDQRV
ncbi:hypothetical protein BJX65DRAFT_300848 [Aspergillus insuetus]